jgi:hypothetical protein
MKFLTAFMNDLAPRTDQRKQRPQEKQQHFDRVNQTQIFL